MRGRLIFPFELAVARIDTTTTAADPDGAGALTAGYDTDFKEPVVIGTGSGAGTVRRVEKTTVRVPAQIEPGEFEKMKLFMNGQSPDSRFVAVAHFRWLEDNGYVNSGGVVLFNPNDRLVAIYDRDDNNVLPVRQPMYVEHLLPGGYGLGRKRNLLFFHFVDRGTGMQ